MSLQVTHCFKLKNIFETTISKSCHLAGLEDILLSVILEYRTFNEDL